MSENLKKVKFEELAAVWKHIVKMHLEKISQVKICKITGANKDTVRSVLKKYKETGKIPTPKIRGRKEGEGKLLSPEQEKEMKWYTVCRKNCRMILCRFRMVSGM